MGKRLENSKAYVLPRSWMRKDGALKLNGWVSSGFSMHCISRHVSDTQNVQWVYNTLSTTYTHAQPHSHVNTSTHHHLCKCRRCFTVTPTTETSYQGNRHILVVEVPFQVLYSIDVDEIQPCCFSEVLQNEQQTKGSRIPQNTWVRWMLNNRME